MWLKSYCITFNLPAIILLLTITVPLKSQDITVPSSPEDILLAAAFKGDTAVLRMALVSGADPGIYSSAGITPLGYAVLNGHQAAVKMLFIYGADPNMSSWFGETPLIMAIKNGDLPMAELLIMAGASVNKTDANGATPLHYAALFGHYYETDLLIYYDTVNDFKALDGTTPLMAAVMSGSYDIADILIQYGANVNSTDDYGYAPLLLAAQNGDTLIAELLLLSGADLYKTASDGYNAASIAIRDGHPHFLKYILSSGNLWAETEGANLWLVADQYRRKDILSLLSGTSIPRPDPGSYVNISAGLSWTQTMHQGFAGLELKSRRNITGTGFTAGIYLKPLPTRIIIEGDDGIYYQYRDTRSVVYAGGFREFLLRRNSSGSFWLLGATAKAGYKFGNSYPGSDLKPEAGFTFIPGLSLQLEYSYVTYSLAVEYMNTEVYRSWPVWLKAGVAFNYSPENVRSKGKSIKWY